MSPAEPCGRRFSREPVPHTDMMNRFLAPELSEQFITPITFIAADILNLLPAAPPRPEGVSEGEE